jgi:hypothetical protein
MTPALAADDALYVEHEVPLCDCVARREQIARVVGRTLAFPNDAASPGYVSYTLAYDRLGRRAHEERINDAGQIVERWRYNQGRLVEELAYDRQARLERRCEVVYDQGTLWREKRVRAASGELMHRIVAERGADGRLIGTIYLRGDPPDDPIRTDRYHYDDRGRLLEVAMGHLGGCRFEYEADRCLLTRRSRDLPGASVLGDVLELHYDPRQLPVTLGYSDRPVTRLEYETDSTYSRI